MGTEATSSSVQRMIISSISTTTVRSRGADELGQAPPANTAMAQASSCFPALGQSLWCRVLQLAAKSSPKTKAIRSITPAILPAIHRVPDGERTGIWLLVLRARLDWNGNASIQARDR
jgi:hypothetical protein